MDGEPVPPPAPAGGEPPVAAEGGPAGPGKHLSEAAPPARRPPRRRVVLAGLGAAVVAGAGAVTGWALTRGSSVARLAVLTNPTGFRTLAEQNIGVAIHPSGRLAAFFGAETGLWDISDRAHPVSLPARDLVVHGVYGAFSPDGRTLATARNASSGGLWDFTRPAQITYLAPSLSDGPLAFSPDGTTLATVNGSPQHFGGTITLWNVTRPAQPSARSTIALDEYDWSDVSRIMFSPDGRTLAAAVTAGLIPTWDVTDPARPAPINQDMGTGGEVWDLAFSPDGRTLATTSSTDDAGQVLLWSATNPARPGLLGTVTDHTGYHLGAVPALAFSPDGQLLATGSADARARVWKTASLTRPHPVPAAVLTGHYGSLASVAFTPDSRVLITTGYDQTARLWDVSHL